MALAQFLNSIRTLLRVVYDNKIVHVVDVLLVVAEVLLHLVRRGVIKRMNIKNEAARA